MDRKQKAIGECLMDDQKKAMARTRQSLWTIKSFDYPSMLFRPILKGLVRAADPSCVLPSGKTKDRQCAKSYRLVLRYLQRCSLTGNQERLFTREQLLWYL